MESKEIQKTCSKDIHELGRRRERRKSGSTRNSNHTPEKVPGPEDQCDEKRNASRGYRESTRAGTHDIAKKKRACIKIEENLCTHATFHNRHRTPHMLSAKSHFKLRLNALNKTKAEGIPSLLRLPTHSTSLHLSCRQHCQCIDPFILSVKKCIR